MKKHSALSLLISISLMLFSLPSPSVTLESEVIADISKRSHTPVGELKTLFADCDKAMSQLDMHLCADKDATTASFKLKQILFNKKSQLLICKSQLKEKIAQWEKLRDNACDKATEDSKDGSIWTTLLLNCVTDETTKMVKKLDKINNCNELNKIVEPIQIEPGLYSPCGKASC
ncbi:lysozyme inhibitor LprI family protein [Rickettsiella endosymbiont of Rhagonycha lignosa]|uniref:lysozyme inhibitor LprI family protein n=1 Tax=Rickettsiella endosymbiont of Rhagonycha lignosa TaxID=3077937 RepID=UPI00313AF188